MCSTVLEHNCSGGVDNLPQLEKENQERRNSQDRQVSPMSNHPVLLPDLAAKKCCRKISGKVHQVKKQAVKLFFTGFQFINPQEEGVRNLLLPGNQPHPQGAEIR